MSSSAGSREGQEEEQALSSSLVAANEQLKAQSDTFLERSKLRSRLGNHAGALKDAQCAVTLSPESVECLIRLSQALIRCGQSSQAFDAYKQASSIVDAKQGQLSSDLAILHRQLLPFDELPNEILAAIFVVLYADWENLPSPFQIPHVCQRWRRIANSTPALWRDTRILRVRDKVPTGVSLFYCLPIKKPYSLARRTDFPLRWSCSRQDGNHIELLRLCEELSCKSLCHIDIEIWDWYEGSDWAGDTVLNLARDACATLTSIALFQTRPDQRQHFDPVGIVRSSGCSTASLELVLLCPKLVDVELSVGELLEVGEDPLPKAALEAEPTPSFRRLHLDCLGGFAAATGPRALRLLLARSAQLTSLTLSNVLDVNWGEWPDADDQPFAIQLIAACANTLVELTIDGFANILSAAFQAGTTVFPHLQRLRHVPRQASAWDAAPQGLVLPELKDVEGPIELIQSLPVVPADITLRLDGFYDCDRIRDWLLGLPYDQSPHALTILVPFSEMIPLKKNHQSLDAEHGR